MNAHEFDRNFSRKVKNERVATHEVLTDIRKCERERYHLVLGFRTTLDWLVKRHGYSETAANRRIQASRLLTEVPEAEDKFLAGELNLTTLHQVSVITRAEEKRIGKKIDKRHVIAKIENKTAAQTEQLLRSEFPETSIGKDSLRAVSATEARLTLDISQELKQKLDRAKDLLNAQTAQVLQQALDLLLRTIDPQQPTPPSATAAARVPKKLRRYVIQRAQICEYRDPVTNQRCDSTRDLQVDHITPVGKGGTNDISNLRCLCGQHNRHAAEAFYGKKHMDKFRTVREPTKPYRPAAHEYISFTRSSSSPSLSLN
jgi:5-methylcytosine-specific restriction endonuclease McrA